MSDTSETYCPKCGEANKQEADNLLVCSNSHETFINPAIGAVAFVLDDDNRMLWGVRSIEPNKGGLCAPGGFIGLNETAEQAAIRETKEEMGITVELVGILGTYATFYERRHILNVVIIAKHLGDVVTPADDMDGGDPVWRPIDDSPSVDELAWDWYSPALDDLKKLYEKHQDSKHTQLHKGEPSL